MVHPQIDLRESAHKAFDFPQESLPSTSLFVHRRNPKGDGRKGTGQHVSQIVVKWHMTIYDSFRSRFLGRGCDKALFSEKKGFSVKRGEAFSG